MVDGMFKIQTSDSKYYVHQYASAFSVTQEKHISSLKQLYVFISSLAIALEQG
jgi:hypothetical protein